MIEKSYLKFIGKIAGAVGLVAFLYWIHFNTYYKFFSGDYRLARIQFGILSLVLIAALYFTRKSRALFQVNAVIAMILLSVIMSRLLVASRDAYKHPQDYTTCHAPGHGDADGYEFLANWFVGKRSAFTEAFLFRRLPTYNEYLTRIFIIFSPTEDFFVTGGGDGFIKFWDLRGRQIGESLNAQQGSVTSLAFTSDGKILASGGWDGTIKVWDVRGRVVTKTIPSGQLSVTSIAFSSDRRKIVSGGWDGTIKLWTIDGRPLGKPFRGHEASLTRVFFSPDGKYIASAAMDWSVRIWKENGELLSVPLRDTGGFVALDFTRDWKEFAAGGMGDSHLCHQEGNLVSWKCSGAIENSYAINFHPRRSVIATGNYDGGVQLWDLQKGGAQSLDMSQTAGFVMSVAYSRDGKILGSTSRDGTVRLWREDGSAIGPPIAAHVGNKPYTTILGTPDYPRQIGYPFLIAAYMKLTGIYNSCAVLTMQPLVLMVFIAWAFFYVLRVFGWPMALGLIIPLFDGSNTVAMFSRYDVTEFTLILFYPIIAGALFLILFDRKKPKFYFFTWLIITFAMAQIKQFTCIFVFLLVMSLFFSLSAAKVLNWRWLRPYDFRVLVKKLVTVVLVTVAIGLMGKITYPEATFANKQFGLQTLLVIPAPPSNDPLLEKFRRLQKIVNRRWAELKNIPYVRITDWTDASHLGPVGENHVEFSLYNEIPLGKYAEDDHAVVDRETGEVLFFTIDQMAEIGSKLFFHNFPAFFANGVDRFVSASVAVYQYTPFIEGSGFLKLIWISLLVVGIAALTLGYGWITVSMLMTLFFLYCFLTFFFNGNDRYWQTFVGFYYFAFAAGFAAVCRYLNTAIVYIRKRDFLRAYVTDPG